MLFDCSAKWDCTFCPLLLCRRQQHIQGKSTDLEPDCWVWIPDLAICPAISAFWNVQWYLNLYHNLLSLNISIIIGMVGFVSIFLVFGFLFVPCAFFLLYFFSSLLCVFMWIKWIFFGIRLLHIIQYTSLDYNFSSYSRDTIYILNFSVCLELPLYHLTWNARNSPLTK